MFTRLKEGLRTMFVLFLTPGLRVRTIIIFYLWMSCSTIYYGVSLNSYNMGVSENEQPVDLSFEVGDRISRHVRDLRAVAPESIAMEGRNEQPDYEDSWDVEPDESLVVHQPVNVGELRGLDVEGSSSESEGSDTGRPLPRRGSRERRPARLFQYNDLP
ncbi:hypothetical protein Pcinc_011467 [Petrolisthes cinctipes]|uniref:Uncharacterized protein n=1 Tax=Petrolisthes cinctipes TaxID=88211 RepID=A0AAE1KSH8_PETCI|nr:hypothetical protein Pcinc_011467 [Petrolisthes cinctipes]